MARQIDANMPLADLESEALYTRAALLADPDAADLVALTASWLERLDALRLGERTLRELVLGVEAVRAVVNSRFDVACTRFADELYLAVDKDRDSARWRQFFRVQVSAFVRQGLAAQVLAVKGWLAGPGDPVLDKHRDALGHFAAAAEDALVKTNATALQRGEQRIRREQLAADFTRERDALEEALRARARERNLPRDWPATFFRAPAARRAAAAPPESEPAAE